MRILALAILAIGAASAALPAQAQTYDPNYPVCLRVYAGSTTMNAAIPPCPNATCRRRRARRNA